VHRNIDILYIKQYSGRVKTISVREMKAHWAEIERQVRHGETFEVLNRGRPAARIVPPHPRQVVKWDDHLATAAEEKGKRAEEVVRADREARW
jgi:prevent-host-death family protein